MEADSTKDNIEYLPPLNPEIVVAWHGLQVVVNNTRLTERQLLCLLNDIDFMPPAA